MKIAVIGGGSWGTAAANLLARNGHQVRVWERQQEVCDGINKNHLNPLYIKDIDLAEMYASTNMEEVVAESEIIVNAVPSAYVRTVMSNLKPYLNGQIIVSLTKGIEIGTDLRPSQVLTEVLKGADYKSIAVLSGPNLAREVATEAPSATVIASENIEDAKVLQKAFMAPHFRAYVNHDLIGVELGGALKNVIAIAAGIGDGIGFGDNTKASLMTRGLVEMTKLATALGAEPETLSGLSGMGDLIATCSSKLSRNRTFGEMIGRGKTVEEAEAELGMVAEGVKTSRAVNELATKLGIDMPICRMVVQVLFEGLPPIEGVKILMTREAKHEMVHRL